MIHHQPKHRGAITNNNNSATMSSWDERAPSQNPAPADKESGSPAANNQQHLMRPQRLGGHHEHQQQHELPLRILVKSDMVGAIIGRSGGTIRQITQQTKARIDVHREDQLDQQDKVITINGSPRSCSDACFRIIDIILNEKINNNNNNPVALDAAQEPPAAKQDDYILEANPEIQLKILAHNNLIGRLIGRKGASIKEIMERTSTKINISVNGLTESTNEHTITVTGRLEQVRQAENLISSKLRIAYQADISSSLQTMNQSPYLFNNVPSTYMPNPYPLSGSVLSSLAGGSGGRSSHGRHHSHHHPPNHIGAPLYSGPHTYMPLYPNMPLSSPSHGLLGYNHMMGGAGGGAGGEFEKETVNIYIPSSMVGALIGKSGSAIKEMICTSGASIKVATAPAAPPAVALNKSTDNGNSHGDEPDAGNTDAKSPQEETDSTPMNSKNRQQAEQNPESTGDVEQGQQQQQQQPEQELSEQPEKEQDREDTTTPVNSEFVNESPPADNSNLGNNQETDSESKTDASNTTQQQIPNSQQKHHANSYHHKSHNHTATRKVTIVGSPEAQFTAQYLIYRKVSVESGKSDISLMVELQVPSQYVGKIIGKGGSTVKHLQMQTRTTIRLPDEKPPQQQQVSNENGTTPGEAALTSETSTSSAVNSTTTTTAPSPETYVQITGEFQGSHLAQRHIRNLIRP